MIKMIKKLIKNRIRNTGMVKELEKNNVSLKNQLDDLKKTNNQLHSQILSLESEKEYLKFELKEKSDLVGFSIKTNLRGLSSDEGKLPVLKYVVENIKKDALILDVGFGAGAYGKLLRSFYYMNIDGLDIYGDHIKEMGLDKIYDNIYIENILDFDFEYYDLIIMGDVLEHVDLESAKKLLCSIVEGDKCSQMVISVPYHYEQDELYGNPHEKHLQPEMDEKYMEKHYPYLKLIDQVKSASNHTIATYCWEKS
jgi:2-polyprenyl-3-methyl-5-hydroxy-6-metoxy-1,4-benzoquinol methylase